MLATITISNLDLVDYSLKILNFVDWVYMPTHFGIKIL